jgi:alpha-ketoglutarate-dependent taurine dioxygenase
MMEGLDRSMLQGSGQDAAPSPIAGGSAFSLDDEQAYRRWRDLKLANYPRTANELMVDIAALDAPTPAEAQAVLAACGRANLCLYRAGHHPDDLQTARRAVAAFARHFGMRHFEAHRSAEADGIVALEVAAAGGRLGYIPYTNRSLGWHTDGYYHYDGPGRTIQSMLLHCVRSAAEGGENGLLDHEIAYIRLRDENPKYIAALMHPQAMIIPPNNEADGKMRPECTGPVFVVAPDSGALVMRFTARKRNIRWREDTLTHQAVRALERVLSDDPLIFRIRLAPGEGVICNNVLHDRIGFDEGTAAEPGRLIYRIRSYDRVRTPEAAP